MEVLVMAGSDGGVQPSQILITFKGPRSIEFDIKLSNVAASQMLLASQWLEIRARVFIEAAEKERRDQIARPDHTQQQILLPRLKSLRGV
jgi:hypothetical protein